MIFITFVAWLPMPCHRSANQHDVRRVLPAELENTVKPIFSQQTGGEDLAVDDRDAEAVAGGEEEREKPFLIDYSEPTPPLVHSSAR